MITFLDEKDVEHGALATIKVTNAVNGERSLTGEIESGDYVLANIERGWRLRFDDEFYVVTYAKPIDDGKTTHVTFDAVHQFFWDFDKSSVHEQLNDGSHTFLNYLDFIFADSGYTYTIDPLLKVYAFEKQSFGYKSRLNLFNDIITASGVEFQVNGKVVRILEKTGTDLSTVVRKNFNMNELGIEKHIGDFVTYQKGFGAWFDENDHTKGRLVTEYTSPLASVYGKLEAEPLVDERYTQADNMIAALKANVDNSYSLSIRLDMEDLTRAGYEYTQPRAGDYIMAINETLDFQEKIRIVSFTSEYDVSGQLIKHEVTCNDIGAVKKLSASYSLTKEQAQNASATVVKAVEMANKALVSADGKSTVYFGTEFPEDEPKGELHKGDSLYLTVGDTTKMYYWTGADWEELPIVNDVKAFQDQINDELKDIPDREEVETTINQKIATSKTEIKTQIDTAKSQAESNAKSYADEINQATAEVADRANAAADALKTDLTKVKTDLTATTSTANSAETSASEAKQQITTVANNLSKAKIDLTDSIAAVDNKADTIQSNVSKAQSDIQTVASNLTKAKQDLQTSIRSVDSKADGIQSNLTKAKTDLQSSISSVDSKTDTIQANLTKAKADLQASIATVDGKTDTVQTNLTKAKNDLQTQINAVPGQITSAVSAVEGKIPTSLNTVNLIKNTDKPFTMGYGITNTTWDDDKKWAYLDLTDPSVSTTKASEILPQWQFWNFKPTKGMTYTQSIMIDTDATFNPNGQPQNSWFTTQGHNQKRGYFEQLSETTYRFWSTCTWQLEDIALRAFDWFDLHNVLDFRNSGTYLAFYKPKLTTGTLPSDWSLAPEDTASQISSLSSQIQQTADGMTLLATKKELNSAKSELNTSIAEVNTKATNLQTDVSNLNASLSNTSKTVQAHATTLANQAEELQNQANQLTAQVQAQDSLTTRVASVETTANGTRSIVSELSKTVESNTNNITSVSNRTKTVETDLTSAKTSISELQTNLSSTQTGLTNLTKRTKDVEDDLSGTKTTLTELSQTVADDGETITGLTTKTATIESSVNGLKTSLTNTKKDLTSVTTRTKNVEDDLAGTKTSLTSLSATVAADGQTITSLSNKTKTIESNVDGLTTSLSNTQKDLTSVTNRTKTVEDTLGGTRTELAELQGTVDTTNSNLASVTQRTSTVESDLSGTKTSLSNLTKTVSDDGKTIASLSSQTKTIESTVNGLSTSLISTQQDLAGITTRTKNVEDDLSGTKAELTELQTTVDTTNTDLANVTKRTKTVEDSLAGTKTNLSSLSQTVASNGQDITSLSSRTKTVEDSVSGLTTTMTSVQQTLTSTTNRTKAVEDDLAGTKTTLSQVQTTADSASQKTATLETGLNGLTAKFDNLKIGGHNYLRGTSDEYQTLTSDNYVLGYTGNKNISFLDLLEPLKGETVTIRSYIKNDTDYPVRIQIWFTGGGIYGNPVPAHEEGYSVATGKILENFASCNVAFTQEPSTVATGGTIQHKEDKLEKGNVATDYSPNEADIEQKVAEYKQNADQNYASLQTTVQNLDGTVQQNKTVADQTAAGFKTRIESLETYQAGETTRANQYFESAKTETARQLTAERTAIANDYVAKSTYTSDVTGLRNDLTATTTTANTTKTNLASYQASNDQAVASLQSSLQTTNGNVSNLQTQINAVPGQITSSVSAVEDKIPTEIGSSNLLRNTSVNADNLKLFSTSNAVISIAEKDGHQTYKIKVGPTQQNNSGAQFAGNDGYYNLVKDRYYTFSFWVLTNKDKSYSSGSLGHIQVINEHGDIVGNDHLHQHSNQVYSTNTIKANTWTKVWYTFKVTSNSYFKPFFWYLDADDEIYVYDMMLNEGKIPLSYTPAPEDTASQINSLSSQIQQTADGMTLLATKTELNSAKSELQSGITTATSKADNAQSTADNNAQTISTHTTQISALNTGLQAKVSQSDFDSLSGRVTTAESNLTAKANELSSKISSVEGLIPTSIDTVNLIKGTGSSFVMYYGITNTTWDDDKKWAYLDLTDPNIDTAKASEILPQDRFWNFKPTKGMTYTQSIMIDTDATFNPNGQPQNSWFTTQGHNQKRGYFEQLSETTYRFWSTCTWQLEDIALRAFDWFDLHTVLDFRNSGTYLAFYKPKLTTGNLPSDWSPSPEDYDNKLASAQSEIKQTTDSISASVSSVQTAASNAQTTADTAVSKADAAQAGVNTLDSTTVKSASLTIGTDGVVMKAGKSTSDIANAIGSYFSVNQNSINLFSDKISVKGSMVVDGAITSTKIASKSINTAHLNGKIITADVIATGAITADAIKAGAVTTSAMSANSINGDRITVGTLDAAKIKAGSITASQIASGTITSSQIATGTISAANIAAGTITGDNIKANSVDVSKISGLSAEYLKAKIENAMIDWMKGKTITAYNGNMAIDLQNGRISFKDGSNAVYRQTDDGIHTGFLHFEAGSQGGIYAAFGATSTRQGINSKSSEFAGIRCYRVSADGDSHDAKIDKIEVIGDAIQFGHGYRSDGQIGGGFIMDTAVFGNDTPYSLNRVIKSIEALWRILHDHAKNTGYRFNDSAFIGALNNEYNVWHDMHNI